MVVSGLRERPLSPYADPLQIIKQEARRLSRIVVVAGVVVFRAHTSLSHITPMKGKQRPQPEPGARGARNCGVTPWLARARTSESESEPSPVHRVVQSRIAAPPGG